MLSPKRTKFRRHHRGNLRGKATRGNKISFGDFGIQALEPCWITSRQIESGRRVLTRYVRRTGKLWIRIFPDKPVTMRAAGSRMGSGKGAPEYWVAVVHPGRILYEISGVPEAIARQALKNCAYKMPIKTKFLTKPVPVAAAAALGLKGAATQGTGPKEEADPSASPFKGEAATPAVAVSK